MSKATTTAEARRRLAARITARLFWSSLARENGFELRLFNAKGEYLLSRMQRHVCADVIAEYPRNWRPAPRGARKGAKRG